MKWILIAEAFALAAGCQALAADLPPPIAPQPQVPPTYLPIPERGYNWSGVYLGINGGYAVGQSIWGAPGLFPPGPFSMDGFQVGGTIGANYQWGHFVFGIEADGDWTNQRGTLSRSDWLATARGRAGYAAFDRILFYATGGAAPANRQVAAGGGLPLSSSTQVGWTAGAGVEVALSPNWTAKIEFLYVDLGGQFCPAASCTVASTVPLTEDVVRAGINYKFNF